MKFELFEEVRVKSKNTTGTIVDISDTTITVESNTKSDIPDGPGGIWPLLYCTEDDLEKVM